MNGHSVRWQGQTARSRDKGQNEALAGDFASLLYEFPTRRSETSLRSFLLQRRFQRRSFRRRAYIALESAVDGGVKRKEFSLHDSDGGCLIFEERRILRWKMSLLCSAGGNWIIPQRQTFQATFLDLSRDACLRLPQTSSVQMAGYLIAQQLPDNRCGNKLSLSRAFTLMNR